MSTFSELRDEMSKAIISGEEERAIALAKESLQSGIAPHRVFTEIITPTLKNVGDSFSRLEIFLPEMMASAKTAKAVFEELQSVLKAEKGPPLTLGKVVIGTVAGDVHDIGKDMVAALLEVGGFDVTNLGCGVSAASFIKAAQQERADIVAMSCLLTTSMPYMKDTLAMARNSGELAKCKIMVGGGPVTAEWARGVGADGYGKDAAEAVQVARRLVGA